MKNNYSLNCLIYIFNGWWFKFYRFFSNKNSCDIIDLRWLPTPNLQIQFITYQSWYDHHFSLPGFYTFLTLNVTYNRKYIKYKHLVWETGKGALKKEIFGCFFRAPFFLSKWCGVVTYFLYKKIRKKKNWIQIYLIEMLHCYWLNKNKSKLDKLNLTRLWVLVTVYQKNTWLFVLIKFYPKVKERQSTCLPIQKN